MQWDLKIKEIEEDPSGLSEGWEKEIWKTYFRESTLEQKLGHWLSPGLRLGKGTGCGKLLDITWESAECDW